VLKRPRPSGDEAKAIAAALLSGQKKAVLLGNAAAQHPQAASLLALANWIGAQTGASVGYLSEAANTVGAQLVGAQPQAGGLNAGQMLGGESLKAVLLLNTDPVLDSANAAAAAKALAAAEMVVVMSPFKTGLEYADVLLPTAPFTETSGTFVNAEGRAQSFVGVVKALGETRPGWKILRVLGNLLNLKGFDHNSSEDVLAELKAVLARTPAPAISWKAPTKVSGGSAGRPLGLYQVDGTVRRAASLQQTAAGRTAAELPVRVEA